MGAPCGQHGQYTFYKALRLTGPSEKIIAIGDFFFVKVWQDSELVSIGKNVFIVNFFKAFFRKIFKRPPVVRDYTEDPVEIFKSLKLLGWYVMESVGAGLRKVSSG